MSCLNLRLPPARKAWKSFASKLQSKLHKLHRSKAIKKPRNRFNTRTSRVVRPSIVLDHHLQRNKTRLFQPSHALHFHHRRRYHFQKSPAPVYIDKLFKEPVPELVEQLQLPPCKGATASKETIVKCQPSTKKMKLIEEPAARGAGTSKQVGNGAERTSAADDMWESVGLASPQMHRIDERAEEFIVRFRAEMELQEALARDLK